MSFAIPNDSSYIFKYVSSQDTILVRTMDIVSVDTFYNAWKYHVTPQIAFKLNALNDKTGDLYMLRKNKWLRITKQSVYKQTLPDGYYYVFYNDSLILKDDYIYIRYHQLSRNERLMRKKLTSAFEIMQRKSQKSDSAYEAYWRKCTRIIKRHSQFYRCNSDIMLPDF